MHEQFYVLSYEDGHQELFPFASYVTARAHADSVAQQGTPATLLEVLYVCEVDIEQSVTEQAARFGVREGVDFPGTL